MTAPELITPSPRYMGRPFVCSSQGHGLRSHKAVFRKVRLARKFPHQDGLYIRRNLLYGCVPSGWLHVRVMFLAAERHELDLDDKRGQRASAPATKGCRQC